MSTKHLVYKRNKGFQRLSGGMAHDLNNIIMILNGFTGCLKKSPGLDEKQMRYIDQIDKATAQVGNLTNTLLTLCEGSILNMSYFNLGELLESFITEKKKGKDFCHKMDLISDIGEAFIYFDRKGMLTVLENLYENSIYPDEESRQISYKISRMVFSETDHREGMSPGSYIVLDISDDGPGIKNEASSEIFDPYYSTKPRGK
jgi:two-component system cell cycle sensor histidine kinase/response regulator CckA